MNVTNSMIRDDIKNIARILKNSEIEIPSLWDSITPGLKVSLCILMLQSLSFIPVFMSEKPLDLYDFFPLLFTFAFAFIVFLIFSSASGKLLSLPRGVRDGSLIIRVYSGRLKIYLAIWLALSIISVVLTNLIGLEPDVTCMTQFISTIVLYFISSIDLGRYDFSIFDSVVLAWRNGSKIDDVIKE